ncbi:MAG: DinB family protein [SAR202 cluster bacterium]|nr:DinB family protein [SAR202 cluster bacterium]
MDFTDIVRRGLHEYTVELRKALDGLTAKERRFQPTPQSHHIDFALWHLVRVEDNEINDIARRTGELWTRGGWYKRLGLPKDESGWGYTPDGVFDLPEFDIDTMMAYHDAVRQETLAYLDTLTQSVLGTVTRAPGRPGYTIADMLGHLLVHGSRHMGQIEYLRGIQRGFAKS